MIGEYDSVPIKYPSLSVLRNDIEKYEFLVDADEISDFFIQKFRGIGLKRSTRIDAYFVRFDITKKPKGFNVKEEQMSFWDSSDQEILSLIIQKFQGALKFQASEAQQIALVELGIITRADLDDAAPMARAAFLEGDLGL